MFQNRKINKQAFLKTIVSFILAGALASLSYFCKSCFYAPVCYGTTIAYGIIVGLSFITFLEYAFKRHYMAAYIFGIWIFFAIWFCLFYLPDAHFYGAAYTWVLAGIFPLLVFFVATIVVTAYYSTRTTMPNIPTCLETIVDYWCPKRHYGVIHNENESLIQVL